MATFTNETKHTATIKNTNKYGIATWTDAEVNWDDTLFSWDSNPTSFTNETKHTVSIINQIKN